MLLRYTIAGLFLLIQGCASPLSGVTSLPTSTDLEGSLRELARIRLIARVDAVALDDGGNRLYVLTSFGVECWSVTPTAAQMWSRRISFPTCMAVSEGLVAVGNEHGDLAVFDRLSGERMSEDRLPGRSIWAVAFTGAPGRVAVASDDRRLRLYDRDEQAIVAEVMSGYSCGVLQHLPTHDWLVHCTSRGARIYDNQLRRIKTRTPPFGDVMARARLLGSNDDTVVFATTPLYPMVLPGRRGVVYAWSPAGVAWCVSPMGTDYEDWDMTAVGMDHGNALAVRNGRWIRVIDLPSGRETVRIDQQPHTFIRNGGLAGAREAPIFADAEDQTVVIYEVQ